MKNLAGARPNDAQCSIDGLLYKLGRFGKAFYWDNEWIRSSKAAAIIRSEINNPSGPHQEDVTIKKLADKLEQFTNEYINLIGIENKPAEESRRCHRARLSKNYTKRRLNDVQGAWG